MINCANSFADGSQIESNGRVLVCLEHVNGAKYFGAFDIGPASAAVGTSLTTGFQVGSSDYVTDFDVDVADEDDTHQCFYVPYSRAAGTTSDQLVLQGFDDNGDPEGDACIFDFSFPQEGGGGGLDPLAVSCANSSVTHQPQNNRLLVCLQRNNGTKYFDQFDIANGTAVGTDLDTGLVTGSSNYVQDYAVDAADQSDNHQCFYIPYAPAAGSTNDQLVLQPLSPADNQPVDDACVFGFNVLTSSSPQFSCEDTVWTQEN